MARVNGIVKIYKKLINDHLLLVNSIEAGILMGTGDLIAQKFIEKKPVEQLEILRTAQFFALGAGLVGPSLSIWYKFLSRTIKETGKFWVIKKVAVDQTLFAPCLMAALLTSVNLLEGHTWQYTTEQLKLKYKDVILTNYKVWPAVQLINFTFVPLRHQVLLVQCVALFWNAYLSWKNRQGKEKRMEEEDLEMTDL